MNRSQLLFCCILLFPYWRILVAPLVLTIDPIWKVFVWKTETVVHIHSFLVRFNGFRIFIIWDIQSFLITVYELVNMSILWTRLVILPRVSPFYAVIIPKKIWKLSQNWFQSKLIWSKPDSQICLFNLVFC